MNLQYLLPATWKKYLQKEFQKNYFVQLNTFLNQESKTNVVLPPQNEIFSAFHAISPDQVKIVLLGQDPYHGIGQAHGMCFSVKPHVKIPPSLRNIFKELQNDLQIPIPAHGNLSKWAEQGVLLLNSSLTVRQSEPGSHQKKGWEIFTDEVIRKLSEEKAGIVFILWGKEAQKKLSLINADKHHVLSANHPSPLSAHRGFFGCKHFSTANEIIEDQGKKPIDWNLL